MSLRAHTDTEDDLESHHSTVVSVSTTGARNQGPSNFQLESSQYMGIDAVKKLRTHYIINRVSLSLSMCVLSCYSCTPIGDSQSC